MHLPGLSSSITHGCGLRKPLPPRITFDLFDEVLVDSLSILKGTPDLFRVLLLCSVKEPSCFFTLRLQTTVPPKLDHPYDVIILKLCDVIIKKLIQKFIDFNSNIEGIGLG